MILTLQWNFVIRATFRSKIVILDFHYRGHLRPLMDVHIICFTCIKLNGDNVYTPLLCGKKVECGSTFSADATSSNSYIIYIAIWVGS